MYFVTVLQDFYIMIFIPTYLYIFSNSVPILSTKLNHKFGTRIYYLIFCHFLVTIWDTYFRLEGIFVRRSASCWIEREGDVGVIEYLFFLKKYLSISYVFSYSWELELKLHIFFFYININILKIDKRQIFLSKIDFKIDIKFVKRSISKFIQKNRNVTFHYVFTASPHLILFRFKHLWLGLEFDMYTYIRNGNALIIEKLWSCRVRLSVTSHKNGLW